jgi:hypothetical protein
MLCNNPLMKKLNYLSAILLSTLSTAAFAGDLDVTPANMKTGTRYVRVTDKVVSATETDVYFEDCLKNEDQKCRQIGKKPFYTLAELRSQASSQNEDVAGAVVGDVVVGAVTALFSYCTMGFGPAALIQFAGGSSVVAVWTGAAVGSLAITATAGALIKKINPWEQYKEGDAINNDVITDKPVQNDDIDQFIERLTIVLNKID